MKKLISMLCMVTCVVSLAACGNRDNNNNATSPSEAPATANPTDAGGTGVTETETLKVGKAEYAAHGTKGFAIAFAVLQGDTIVATYVDDYQVMAKDETKVVPNSDKDFGGYFSDIKSSLASKRENNEYYSKLMKDNAGATIDIAANLDAIGNYAVGKTVEELKTELDQKDDQKMVDAVSGSTLADTKGYLLAILKAAENAESTDNAINNENVNDTTGNGNPSAAKKNNTDLSEGATGSPAVTDKASKEKSITKEKSNAAGTSASPAASANAGIIGGALDGALDSAAPTKR